MPALVLSDVTVGYEDKNILEHISLTIEQGISVGIAGPNGAGKTTLIKTLVNILPLVSGSISILGTAHTTSTSKLAYVPQRSCVDWNFPATVFDMVLMGTYKRLGWFARPGKAEYDRAYQALAAVELSGHADTPLWQLSGGQQQRAFIARALAQEADVYVLDVPFNGIDEHAQSIILRLFKALQHQGKTILVVHHDLQTVAEQFDYLLLLNKKIVAYGKTETILTPHYICAAYNNQTLFTNAKL
jgi:manganese/zinc/iron transport system ATP- binding protein